MIITTIFEPTPYTYIYIITYIYINIYIIDMDVSKVMGLPPASKSFDQESPIGACAIADLGPAGG
jgi:hypothetical protein